MTSAPVRRIAMWSGPRNISTALLRAWGNRPEAFVTDEPLYAHYLQVTGLPHPGADGRRSADGKLARAAALATGAGRTSFLASGVFDR